MTAFSVHTHTRCDGSGEPRFIVAIAPPSTLTAWWTWGVGAFRVRELADELVALLNGEPFVDEGDTSPPPFSIGQNFGDERVLPPLWNIYANLQGGGGLQIVGAIVGSAGERQGIERASGLLRRLQLRHFVAVVRADHDRHGEAHLDDIRALGASALARALFDTLTAHAESVELPTREAFADAAALAADVFFWRLDEAPGSPSRPWPAGLTEPAALAAAATKP